MTDSEEEMRQRIDQLNLPAADPDTNVALLSEPELLNRYQKVNRKLLKRGEILEAVTQDGRDLHSTRGAYIIEMQRRGMRGIR